MMKIAEKKRGQKIMVKDASDKEVESFDEAVKEFEAKKFAVKRNEERGSVGKQLEYIVENGLDAFIQRDHEIRARNPKPVKVKK